MTTILGRSRSPYIGLIRMMIPCMVLSAFLNNTPIVALLCPVIQSWCRRTGVPQKKVRGRVLWKEGLVINGS